MGVVAKGGYTEGVIGATPMGNAYTFFGTTFGWLCCRLVSLPTRRCRLLSILLNAGRCKCLWRNLGRLPFFEEGFGELSEDNSSSAGVFVKPEKIRYLQKW